MTDKYGQPLVKVGRKTSYWVKNIGFHRKASYRTIKEKVKFPEELKIDKTAHPIEWSVKTNAVKIQKPDGTYEYKIHTEISYLLSDHSKYTEDFYAPSDENTYVQIGQIYKTKERKTVEYEITDVATRNIYTCKEFENETTILTREEYPGQQDIIPEWLQPFLNPLTAEEWYQKWREGPNAIRAIRRGERNQRNAKIREAAIAPYKEKIKQLRISHAEFRREISKTKKATNTGIQKLARKMARKTTKIETNLSILNELANIVNNGQLPNTMNLPTNYVEPSAAKKKQGQRLYNELQRKIKSGEIQKPKGGRKKKPPVIEQNIPPQPPTETIPTPSEERLEPVDLRVCDAPAAPQNTPTTHTESPKTTQNPGVTITNTPDLSSDYAEIFKRWHRK